MKTGRPVLLPGAHNTTTPHLMTPSWMAGAYLAPDGRTARRPAWSISRRRSRARSMRAPRTASIKYTLGPGRTNSGQGYAQRARTAQETAGRGRREREGLSARLEPGDAEAKPGACPIRIPARAACWRRRAISWSRATIDKTVAIYRADNGKKLWEMNVDQAGVAGPITYMIDGEQYIAVNVGWGGSTGVEPHQGRPVPHRARPSCWCSSWVPRASRCRRCRRRMTTPSSPMTAWRPTSRGAVRRSMARTAANCHGDSAIGGVKDLRKMSAKTPCRLLRHRTQGPARGSGHAQLRGTGDRGASQGYLWLSRRAGPRGLVK